MNSETSRQHRRSTREIKPAYSSDDWVVKKPVKKKRNSDSTKIVETDENNNEVPFDEPASESPGKTPQKSHRFDIKPAVSIQGAIQESVQPTPSLPASLNPGLQNSSTIGRPKRTSARISSANVDLPGPAKPLPPKKPSKYVKKGRKPRPPKPSVPADESDGEYTCSRCGLVFQRKAVAERHVLIEHYGVARLNDPNNEFDDREVLAGYKAAIRVLKSLRCSLCGKSFCSALGLKCHHDVCGFSDAELRRKCEVCGSMLKFRSLKSHMEIHKREERELQSSRVEEIVVAGRPVRNSAKRANEFLKSNAEHDDSDLEWSRAGKKRRRRDSNGDFYLSDSEADDTDSISSSGSTDQVEALNWFKGSLAHFKLSVTTERSFLLFKLWKQYIRMPDAIAEKIAGYDESTGFRCDLCNQMFANDELLTFHYSKCDQSLDSSWSCGRCSFTAETDLISLLRHLIEQHMSELAEMPNQLYDALMPKSEFRRPRSSGALPHVFEAETFHRMHFGRQAFLDWTVDKRSIKFLGKLEQERYLPERKTSAKFKFKVRGKKEEENKPECQPEDEWRQLKLFESVVSPTNQHTTIYTGGPVYSGAWCPYPANEAHNQLLCLATGVESRVFNVFDCTARPGLLQFWSFGTLKYNQETDHQSARWATEPAEPEPTNGPSAKRPKLEFMIAHDYGTILEMAWCPGGTTYLEPDDQLKNGETNEDNQQNGRMGLLALACSDGHVRILAIPLVEDLNRLSPGDETKVFKCRPVAVLAKHPIGLSVMGKPTICKSLAWCSTDGQRHLAAGYGNGLISLFDLQTSSSLLKKVSSGVIQLKPRKSWIAHGAMISSLRWVPTSGCAYIVSASFDRHVKIWCLDDMVTNITLPKRSIITCVDWLPRYPGCFFSSDDCYANLHNNVTYKDCTPSNYANSLSRHKSTVWDFNISSWANVQVGVDAAGEAILSVYVKPKNSKKHTKTRPFECVPVYRQTLEALDESDEQSESADQQADQSADPQAAGDKGKAVSNLNFLIDSSRPLKATLDEIVDSYGIVFNEVDLSLYSQLPASELERLKMPETMNYPRLGDYPLCSLNKCQWNPNRSSYNWLFTAGESGLTRISYIAFLKNAKFSMKYA